MNSKVLLAIIGMSYNFIAFGSNTFSDFFGDGYDYKKIMVVDSLNRGKKNFISFVMDDLHNMFLVKQETRFNSELQYHIIPEQLGAYIAECIGVSANRVRIIPAHIKFPGKIDKNLPASLHTLVSGIPAAQASEPFNVFIQQPHKSNISKKKWGLTRQVITNMAIHPDLPPIVALDTFIGNVDRHRGNFFYDKELNRFFAIDFGCSLKHNLSRLASNFVKNFIKDKKIILTDQEFEALVLYRDTLKTIIKKFSLKKLHKLLYEFCTQLNMNYSSRFSKNDFWKNVEQYKTVITASYEDMLKLVKMLDRYLNSNSEHKNKYSIDIINKSLYREFNMNSRASGQQYVCQSILDKIQAYKQAFIMK